MPKVNVALAGFSEVDPITTIVPTYEGDSFPVSYSIVSGDFGIHNDNYTIDSSGVLRVLVKPTDPIQNLVRYRITTDHDSCQWVEDFLQIFWSETDFTPVVLKYVKAPGVTSFSVDDNDIEVAFIDNLADMPVSAEYTLRASYKNNDPAFVASLFTVSTSGVISVADIFNIVEGQSYHYTLVVTDPNTTAKYSMDICLGPFDIGTPLIGQIISAAECITTTEIPDGFEPTFDCSVLQPRYPDFLTSQELSYYETNCLDSEIVPPIFAVLYEPLTTDFLEARSYTITMSGLDSGINEPQTINFPEGESLVTFDLVGDIKTITAIRTAASLVVTLITSNNDIINTVNLHERDVLTDPLLATFIEVVYGYSAELVYEIRSNQTYKFSDDHGLYVRHITACYGRLGSVLGEYPDTYSVPNGGDFDNATDCLGG